MSDGGIAYPPITALLGISPPTYTGGGLPQPAAPATTFEARLHALREADAAQAREALEALTTSELDRMADEIAGTAAALGREIDGERATQAIEPWHEGPRAHWRREADGAERLADRVKWDALTMLQAQREQLRALDALIAHLVDARHSELPGTAQVLVRDAQRTLQFRIDGKNVAEARHELSCLEAAARYVRDAGRGDLDRSLREVCGVARQNLRAQVQCAQQHALLRTRDTAAERIGHCLGLAEHLSLAEDGRLTTFANFLHRPEAMAQALDLVQLAALCDELLACYRKAPEALREERSPGEVLPYGWNRSLLAPESAQALLDPDARHVSLARLCSHLRATFLGHAQTFERLADLVHEEETPLAQFESLNAAWARGLDLYGAAVDQAWSFARRLPEASPAAIITFADRLLLALVETMTDEAARLGALDAEDLSLDENLLRHDLVEALADLNAQRPRWRDGRTLLCDFLDRLADFACLAPREEAQGAAPLERDLRSVLGQDSPWLAPLPPRWSPS